MADNSQFCTFIVGNLYCGVDVMAVQEVLRYQSMTSVPLAPPEVMGLINLRGQIVTALDMRKRLGLDDRAEDEQPMNVIVRSSSGDVLSLLVDEIGDVIEADPALCESLPETLTGPLRTLFSKTYKLENRLLLVLDIEKTVHFAAEENAA